MRGRAAVVIERVIRILKRDESYRLESDYGRRQLFGILAGRGMQALRGGILSTRFRRAGGLVFAGRRVVVEHAYQLVAGANLIVEDGVFISALSRSGIQLGRNVTVGRGAQVVCTGVVSRVGEGLRIGDNSTIGAMSFVAAQGGVTIGNDVIMGPGVRIFSENHEFGDSTRPIRKQGESRIGVVIEDDCWIGASAVILDGVRIGRGCVVAAGAIVTRSMPPDSVVAGVPARVVRARLESAEGKDRSS